MVCRFVALPFPSDFASEALQAKIGTLSLDKQAKLDEEAAKKEKKAEAKAGAAQKKLKVCVLLPTPRRSSLPTILFLTGVASES